MTRAELLQLNTEQSHIGLHILMISNVFQGYSQVRDNKFFNSFLKFYYNQLKQ